MLTVPSSHVNSSLCSLISHELIGDFQFSLCFVQVQSEVNFLGRLVHPNLVKLLGYCKEERELLLVYEFMPKGSLENHLFRSKATTINLTLTLYYYSHV